MSCSVKPRLQTGSLYFVFLSGRHAMMIAGAEIPEWLSLISMSALWLIGGSSDGHITCINSN
jgi:hypothetical protein